MVTSLNTENSTLCILHTTHWTLITSTERTVSQAKKSIWSISIYCFTPCYTFVVIEHTSNVFEQMGEFAYDRICPGRWMTPNIGTTFFYGETHIWINISIDGIQPTCMYRLRVSRGPDEQRPKKPTHFFCFFWQVLQVKFLYKDH